MVDEQHAERKRNDDFRKLMPPSNINFNELVKEHGYVKARQHLQREATKHTQSEINAAEIAANTSKQPQRLKESLRLAKTYGSTRSEDIVERILKVNPKYFPDFTQSIDTASIEKLLSTSSKVENIAKSVSSSVVTEGSQTHASLGDDSLLRDTVLLNSLRQEDGEISSANQDTDSLPPSFGDTLFLQLAHVQRISCARNNLTSLLSYKLPMLSTYHLRNVREMNLSLNKIQSLPNDFGLLAALERLNLSNNMLSALPASVSSLKKLKILNLAHNSLSTVQDEVMLMDSLEQLNLSHNLLASFPYALVRLQKLAALNLSFNSCIHLAVMPPLLKPRDMWIDYLDKSIGQMVFMNVFTREKMKKIEFYDGAGVAQARDLHVFQPESHPKAYLRRKMWLSICQTYEWEPVQDSATGSTYFVNNVSGESSWTMPAALDSLGLLTSLTELTMTNNSIKEFPPSFGRLLGLKKLVFRSNKLASLPADVGLLKALAHLDLASNELRLLPVELCECSSLVELCLNDNSLLRLPEQLGSLPRLRRLDLSVNRLSSLPFSLGLCSSLGFLNASENPLTDPPLDEFSKGLQHVQWYCRSRLAIEQRGMPPEMRYHTIGVLEQVTILKPEFDRIVEQMVAAVGKDGLLNLQLLGLRKIPLSVLKMKNLRKLKLDYNEHLQIQRGFPHELSSLSLLSLKSCKMTSLPENMSIFTKMTTLVLDDNRLEQLPEEIVDMTTLVSLDVARNRLYSLPDEVENLTNLKNLNLESNYLEYLPTGIGKLAALTALDVSKNRLVDLPAELCDLRGLARLNVEKNKLRCLPSGTARLGVSDLRIGHNRIEWLPDGLFASQLGRSLRRLSLCENNLLQLPGSTHLLAADCFLEADYNPLLSPPSYMLADGFRVIQNYMQIREQRRTTFLELMAEEDFQLDPQSLVPAATEVLQEGTGFLTPDDLAEFDQAVDELINGEFFKCPASAAELVAAVVRLRDLREREIYLAVLHAFLAVLTQLARDKGKKSFGEGSVFEATRPWGRQGEPCGVWVVSLHCLLRASAPSTLLPAGRPSLFSLIQQALPPLAFPFTVDLLKDSLRLYQSPYGPVAQTEEVEFPACDCIDEVKNRPRRHKPCVKAAVVLAKSVYVEEEAARREQEEAEYLQRFAEVDDELVVWLDSSEGRKCAGLEVTRRKKQMKEEVALRREMLQGQTLRLKKANEEHGKLLLRRTAYENAEPFEVHGYRTLSEAVKELSVAEGRVLLLRERIQTLKESIEGLQRQIGLEHAKAVQLCAADLLQKYCCLTYRANLTKYRRLALEQGLQRHWDGPDGADYQAWWSLHTATSEQGSSLMEDLQQRQQDEQDNEEDGPEFSWDETDHMHRFQCYLVDRYLRDKRSMFAFLNN
mmetsp:Transcript_11220/g.15459  ORF Transcript_11220/g.15459 Transcript_11220/m.15459 type:complete len:1381 (+) Transcript_11220:57-4199(+)